MVLMRTPAKRWGAPDDMRGVAVFLAARPPTSSQAPPFPSTAAIPYRAELGGPTRPRLGGISLAGQAQAGIPCPGA